MWWLPAASVFVLGAVLYVGSALHVLNFGPIADFRTSAQVEPGAAGLGPMSTTALAAEEVRQRSSIRTIQLWAGEPAPSIPLDVPVPNDAGLNRAGDGVLNSTKHDRAMLTSADDLPVLIAMYRAELGVRGWQEVRSWLSHPVDATDGPSTVVSAF